MWATIKKPYIPIGFQLNGIDNEVVQQNVITTLENLRARLHTPINNEEVKHYAHKAPRFIQRAVEPYGYFNCKVATKMTKTKKGWMAQFQVTLGRALPITSIQTDIEGAGKTDPEFIKWKKELPFHVGAPLKTQAYENAKTKLYNLATERGYFQAKMVKNQIQINLHRYQASIVIVFDTGPRYRFGATTFSETPFYKSFLDKFITYHAGEYYNAKKLENSQERLVRSNSFDQVTPKPDIKAAENNIVPIRFSLITRKSKEYTLGLGYGTDTGVRGTAGVILRQIGHQGQRFKTLLRASQSNSSLTSKYIIPGFDPANDVFTIGAGVSNMQQSTGNAHNAKFALEYVMTRGNWNQSLALAYLNERYNIVTLPFTSTQLVYPTYDVKYSNIITAEHPRKGLSIDTQLTGASQSILSEATFFQAQVHLRTLYTVSQTHTRLLFRSDLGHTDITNIANLPLSLQLFAGGSRSVRGYGYNSIGPGRNMVVASTEVQQKVVGAFYIVGFLDAGTVNNNNIFNVISMGTGPGIAWISEIGSMELTYANAFTQSNKPWSLQFTMGAVL
ncbi:MAG: BamA/TamA family outer membrane protein [Gammaproteobacteria bacterium]|nr:BamA/TamA family outer membrane protein [Gammaproteobacteria bacterium]